MPLIDKPLAELKEYKGISTQPTDFDAYWERALKELAETDPAVELKKSDALKLKNTEIFDLYFTGVGGARIYAKVLRPRGATATPGILVFHGYSGNSGDWMSHMHLVSEGATVVAMDCRGQGGQSEDVGGVKGNTLKGHIIRGLDDPDPDKLLFRQHFLDTVQLVRVVSEFDWVDENRLGCTGGSQGGALSLVCAALSPQIKRCLSIFPFLSDYRRVWEMDMDKRAYEELADYFRRFDPLHEREEEIFEKLAYIDVSLLAPRIKAEVLMGITLMDITCPPSTQFAAYNNISSKKSNLIYYDYGHEGLPGIQDAGLNFFSE
ncbi:MAG: acetylxylan esterase, partial [Chthoniobacterales bacterium]